MTTTRRFKLDGQVYEYAASSEVTLRDLLTLEQESAALGHTLHMGEIVRLGDLFQTLTAAEARVHPESGWMFTVTIWMAMVKRKRDVGDQTPVSFDEVLASNLGTFEVLPMPGDHADPKAPKAAKKAAARKGSARAGGAAAGR